MRRMSLLAAAVACALLAPTFAVTGLAAPGADKARSEKARDSAARDDRDARKGGNKHEDEPEPGGGDDDGSGTDNEEPKESPSPKTDDRRDDRKVVASEAPGTPVLESAVVAEPSSIAIGDESRVTVTVTNAGDAEAGDVEALLSIPGQLDLGDASEPYSANASGNKVTFDLGSITPGGTASAWADVEGAVATDASGVEMSAVASADEQDVLSDPGSATVVVLGEAGEVDLRAMTREVLVQVGRRIHYTIIVTNDSHLALADVSVIDRVPGEVDVFAAYRGEADAVLASRFGNREDIVWTKSELAAGETLRLSWIGTAKALGDLAALNRVTVKAVAAAPARESHVTYLGAARFAGTTNPPFEPIVKARRVTREVTLPTTGAAGTEAGGSLLPFTGSGNLRWLISGLALLTAGVSFLWAKRSTVHRRRWIAVALACVLLALSACVGSDEPAEESQESRKEEVKGQRIERNQNEKKQNRKGRGGDEGDDAVPGPVAQPPTDVGVTGPGEVAGVPPTGGTTTGDTATGDDGAAAPTPPPETTTVSEVRITRIGVDDLPIVVLGPTAADNSLRYTWDEPSRDILGATSSVTFTRGQPVDFTTSVGTDGNAIHVGAVLRNVARDRRLAVSGRVIHEVSDSSGTVATFEAPVDTVLAPGGETSAAFTYLLPSGDYTVTARFEPS